MQLFFLKVDGAACPKAPLADGAALQFRAGFARFVPIGHIGMIDRH
jgi:hypothetical protein